MTCEFSVDFTSSVGTPLFVRNWLAVIHYFSSEIHLSVILVKGVKSSVRFVHLSKYSIRALHTIYSGKEYHSFHQVTLHGSLLVSLSFMGIKL